MKSEAFEFAKDIINNPDMASVAWCIELARMVIAEHPADDQLPVDNVWLLGVGLREQWYDDVLGVNQCGWKAGMGIQLPTGQVYLSLANNVSAPDDLVCKTRGDVRRLARALKIDLKEVTE